MSQEKFYVTIGAKPFGAKFSETADDAIRLAVQAKNEFPNADVVAWCDSKNGTEPFEIWENGNALGGNYVRRTH
jgi:hypothetical protein